MRLFIDADVIAYHAAYSKEGNTVSGVVAKVDSIMEDILWECAVENKHDVEYSTFLTGKGNFRTEVSDVYKANRKGSKPATHALARQRLIDQWGATVTEGQEADDAIAIAVTENGYEDSIIVSVDKDFKQLPCMIYDYKKKSWLLIDELGAKYNFWKQVLTGDTVDNIKGLQGCGPKTAEKILKGLTTDEEMFKAVLKAYEGNLEDLTKTARLVYLRRKENETWQPPEV